MNSGWAVDQLPIRFQIGGSFGAYNLNGRDVAGGTALTTREIEQQTFLTAGVYQRSDVSCGKCVSWGIVYDYLHDDTWGERAEAIQLGQIRAQLGLACNECDEIGVRVAFEATDDELILPVRGSIVASTLNQLHFFWKRNWLSGAETSTAFVLAEEPGEYGFVIEGLAPLNPKLALYGSTQFINPSTSAGDRVPNGVANSYSEEAWNVSFGIVFSPGGKAQNPTVSGYTGLPLLPVANNGWLVPSVPRGELR